jgi:hypothetical protein
MAIDTDNEKFALIVFGRTTDPANLPVTGGDIETDDEQQLLWNYPGIAFAGGVTIAFVLDMNTRIKTYLTALYTASEATATNDMVDRYLDAAPGGDVTATFHQLIDDATP